MWDRIVARIDEERQRLIDRRDKVLPQLRNLQAGWKRQLQALASESRYNNRYSVHQWEWDEDGKLTSGLKVVPSAASFHIDYPLSGDGLRMSHSCEYFRTSLIVFYLDQNPEYPGCERILLLSDKVPPVGSPLILDSVAKWIARDIVARDSAA